MAELSGPFDVDPPDTPGGYEGMYQADWSRMARVWHEDAVVGDQGGAALQVYLAGAQVGLRVGEAEIRGHWYRLTGPKLWTPSPNTSGQPRIDRVVLRLDRAAKKITAEIVAGTAGSGAPALTQSDASDGVWEISVGGYVIPAGDTLPTGQFDERMFQGLRVWRPSSEDQLRGTSGAPLWQPAVLPDGRRARWNGATWLTDTVPGPFTLSPQQNGVPWAVGANGGLWWRRDGLIEAHLWATHWDGTPRPAGPITVDWPGGIPGANTYVGYWRYLSPSGALFAEGNLTGAGPRVLCAVQEDLTGYGGATYRCVLQTDFYYSPIS